MRFLPNQSSEPSIELTTQEWIDLLEQPDVFDNESMRMLLFTMGCPNEKSTNYDMGKAFGVHPNKIAAINRSLSKRIFKALGIDAPKNGDGSYRYWDVCFFNDASNPRDDKGHWWWIVYPTLADAIDIFYGIDASLPDGLPEQTFPMEEGTKKTIEHSIYERNPAARKACIEHYGYRCSVCGMDYESLYGPAGIDKIHVHHLIQLSEVRDTHKTDPVRDLRPVCANCHLIIHAKTPAYTIDEVKQMIREKR